MSKISKDYLRITFLIMIACWGTCVIFSINGFSLYENYILYIPWILGGLSPTFASYIALKKNKEVSGFKEWLKKIFDVKQKVYFYLLAIFLPAVYYISQCLIAGYEIGLPFYLIVIMLPVMMIGGGLEEAGWRMILQPELEKKYSFGTATLIVTVIWLLWHLPLFFIRGTSQFLSSYFFFGIAIIASGFSLAVIKKVTNSTFLCVLAHCLTNSFSGIFIFKGNFLSYSVSTVVVIIASYIVLKLSRKYK